MAAESESVASESEPVASAESESAEPEDEETESELADTGTGLEPPVAGALSYLLGPLTGILFYALEPEDAFVRFHAAQSTILFGGLFVGSMALSIALTVLTLIPVVGWVAAAALGVGSLLLAPVSLVAWAFLMYKAYGGAEYEVPLVAPYARRYAAVE